MGLESSGYSPNIQIHLEIGPKKIRLSDVLYDSATLFETVEVPPNTCGSLVFLIDGIEEREDVILRTGITRTDSLIKFSYTDPGKINGRHFSAV